MDDYFPLIEMFFIFLFILYLSGNHAGDEEIVDCATDAPPKRPTIRPEYCQDLTPDTCNALFAKLPATYTENLDPYVHFPSKIILINVHVHPIR